MLIAKQPASTHPFQSLPVVVYVSTCRRLIFAVTAFVFLALAPLPRKTLPHRLPLGWNSWDAYGLTINEADYRANTKSSPDSANTAGNTPSSTKAGI